MPNSFFYNIMLCNIANEIFYLLIKKLIIMKNQIKKLFNSLSKAEQTELLKELSSNTGTSISIADFSMKHQKRYGKNVEFIVGQSGLDHAPVISATAHTSFGDFKATGSNQKIAKANAIEKANESW